VPDTLLELPDEPLPEPLALPLALGVLALFVVLLEAVAAVAVRTVLACG
jgi:hypothetical protein